MSFGDTLRKLFSSSNRSKPRPRRSALFQTLLCTVPEGWASRTGEGGETMVVESRRVYRAGPVEKPDRFTIAAMGAGRDTVETIAPVLIAEMTDPATLRKAGVPPTTVRQGATETMVIDGLPAIVHRGQSLVNVGAATLTYDGPRVFVVHAQLVYIVAARYSIDRAAQVEPIAQQFLAGIRFVDNE